jgi:hypothetical protein
MDFHNLQKMLYEIEPTDPTAERAALEAAASGREAPARQHRTPKTVNESMSVPAEPIDEVSQLVALAGATAKQPAPVSDEASELAALAGIPINEAHKKGKAGQLKGKDKVSKSSTSKSGEQKNSTRGKLVGSTEPRNNGDELADDFDSGFKAPNKIDPYKGAGKSSKGGGGAAEPAPKEPKGLPPKLAAELGKYSTALSNIFRKPDSREAKQFKELMKAADPNLQLEAYMESKKEYDNPRKATRTTQSSDVSSIKEELFRRLDQKR